MLRTCAECGWPYDPKSLPVATFDADKSAMEPLRELGFKFKDDKNSAWRQGRFLAGVLVAWSEQIRAAEKAAKKS